MTTIALIVIGFAIICWLEIPWMVERKYWKELGIFSAFLLLAFSLTLLHGLGVQLPNPNNAVEKVLNYISR